MKLVRFIADVNVEKPIVDYLSEDGYDIKWIPNYDCEITDENLLNLANKEKRILITNDKDFGELIFLQEKLSTGIILIRIKGQKTKEKLSLVKKLLKNYSHKLLNHFTVITEKKIRFIPLEGIR
ncbi:MAG: DUF5615 family PIN-like protein [Nitrospirae bacterium]|nr:DUF5615 family PIN-like protein [Nitrospirota bacterium]